MTFLTDLLPLIWFLGAFGLLVLVVRLNQRVSRGSRSAGPREVAKPDPVGLTATPWELEAIDLQLTAPMDSPARRDLVATVNRLIAASRDRADLVPLSLSASNQDIAQVIAELESKLDPTPVVRDLNSPLSKGKDRIGWT